MPHRYKGPKDILRNAYWLGKTKEEYLFLLDAKSPNFKYPYRVRIMADNSFINHNIWKLYSRNEKGEVNFEEGVPWILEMTVLDRNEAVISFINYGTFDIHKEVKI